MAYLDDLVLKALEERLFAPERLAEVLSAVMARRTARAEAIDARLVTLQSEVSGAEVRLRRLYRMVEEGIAEMDDILRERVTVLKAERERAQAALDRARQQTGGQVVIGAEKVASFARLMREVLSSGDTTARKAYLRAILSAVEVDDKTVRIVGSHDVLHAAAASTASPGEVVQFSGPKWCTRQDETGHWSLEVAL